MPTKIDRVRPKYLVIGEILRPHGIRGEVRTRIVSDYPDRLTTLKKVYLGDSAHDARPREHLLNKVRFNKEFALLTLDGYRSREDADRVRNKIVMIDIADAAPLEQGEYYLFELIGLNVSADGQEIGVIREVLQTGANDVYVVASEDYGDILIPAHEQTVVDIDFDAECVCMTLPEGLLPTDKDAFPA